ncbi:1180_t:CDS:2 [Funneliformis mosseae]|uniref:1180_t:CDS:1 n=1 Tax=Funneliformis mosseae TaxID=27381 RepID=A0A9N9BBU9_FUNMO|nr:1180_t:CDS:2 [Funneliformis mosseae]
MGKVQSKTGRQKRSKSSASTISIDQEIIHKKRDVEIYNYIDKRKYCASYVLPLDDDEIDRLTLQHYIFQNIWKSNFSSPVDFLLEIGSKVLDVGCGPGVWSLEMANKYPKSSFTGIDIVATFPQTIKPENTNFIVGNLKRLPFEDNSFDFVYMRLIMFALTISDWPEAIKELIRVCKPNGWIEIMERDILWHNESDLVRKWRTSIVDKIRQEKGIELIISPHIPGFLHSNNQLTNIEYDKRKAKIGWGEKMYEAYGQLIMWGAKNLSNAVSDIQFNEGQYNKLVEVAIKEIARNKGYDKSYRFWAQKKSL